MYNSFETPHFSQSFTILLENFMNIYSKKIIRFINEIERKIQEILAKEIGLKTTSKYFYDRAQEKAYRITVVIYNNMSMLGYFDSEFRELGFNECLMYASKEQLHNVIRHELAHYLTYIHYGDFVQAHGPEFRAICERAGWGEEVYKATAPLERVQNIATEENPLFRKIQKLMALASSTNKNEAEQAMIKSQELLVKYNIESSYIDAKENNSSDNENDEKVFLKRILGQTKENAKMRAICHILGTFLVNVVYNRSDKLIYIEISGSAVNIEVANHVAHVLDNQLDQLWFQAQEQANLKGVVAKNSFFLGLAKGYCDKVNQLKKDYQPFMTNALMVIEKQLIDMQEMIYPRLSRKKSQARHCSRSSSIGEQMGRQLHINPTINKSSGTTIGQIAYSKG